jgi:hypothetical protein
VTGSEERIHDVRSDEPGSPGDGNTHGRGTFAAAL